MNRTFRSFGYALIFAILAAVFALAKAPPGSDVMDTARVDVDNTHYTGPADAGGSAVEIITAKVATINVANVQKESLRDITASTTAAVEQQETYTLDVAIYRCEFSIRPAVVIRA